MVCNNDLSYLLRDRNDLLPDNAAQVWSEIFEEYLLSLKSDDIDHYQRLRAEIKEIKIQIYYINSALLVLALDKKPELIADMENYGYRVKDDDIEQYYLSLDKIRSQAKGLQVTLEMREKEIKAIAEKQNKIKIDELYFSKILVNLSKHMGYRIDPRVVSVTEFVQLQDSLKKEIEWQHRK